MDFELSDDQKAFVETARAFSDAELFPHAGAWDAHSFFPVETIKKSAELGFAGLYCQPEFGGTSLTRLDSAMIFEELARGCISTAAYISIHNMVCWMIDSFAHADLKKKYLDNLTSMKHLASYCLTEPSSGSDAAALKTRAVREGDHYIVNGSKAFISGAGTSDIYLVMVRTGEEGPKGITTLIIEKDMKGVSFGALEKKMGWKSQPTAVVNFDNVKVPVTNRLGEEGEGFKFAMKGLDGGRINIAACATGGASRALDLAKNYLHERTQFGKKLSDFQALQFKIADMVTELESAKLMVYKAASLLDKGNKDATQFCAMAKRFATDISFKVANEALQLHGGYGYIHEYNVERIVRDLRVHQILEGTNEIMRVIVARKVLGDK